MYPVVKRYGEGIALGYVLIRLLEAVAIVVGIISVLAIVSLRQAAGDTAAALLPVNEALVAIHDWTFLVGPLWFFGTNSLLLAYLMYRSGLVPPVIALLGMVGGPLVFVSGTAIMFGAYEQLAPMDLAAALPVFAWEVSLALWLVIKGFKTPQPAADRMHPAAADPALSLHDKAEALSSRDASCAGIILLWVQCLHGVLRSKWWCRV